MALTVTSINRTIKFKDLTLADLNPDLPIADVVKMHALQYPELATASIAGPEISDGVATYTLNARLGTKG